MRSWLEAFLREPHPLPPDPGPGYERISMTLSQGVVNAVSAHLGCSASAALRRIAVERTGARIPTAVLVSRAIHPDGTAPQMRGGRAAWGRAAGQPKTGTSGTPQNNPSEAGAVIGALVHGFLWILFMVAWFILTFRKKKIPKGI